MNAPPEARRSGTGKGTGRSSGHRRANRRRPRRWPSPGSLAGANGSPPMPALRLWSGSPRRMPGPGQAPGRRGEHYGPGDRGRHRRTSSTAPPPRRGRTPDGRQKSGPGRETPRRAQGSPATTPGYSRAQMVRPRIAPPRRSAGDPGAVDGPAGTTIIGRPTERATVPGPTRRQSLGTGTDSGT